MQSLKEAYYRLPPGLRARIPLRLEAWLREGLWPRLAGQPSAALVETRLWSGFSRPALADLEALVAGGDPREAAAARLALARWHGAAGDFAAAFGHAVAAREAAPAVGRDRRQALLEALFLCRLGRAAEARARLDALPRRRFDPAALLLRASSWTPAVAGADADEGRALDALNAVFRRFGLAPLGNRDPAAPLSLDNLQGLTTATTGGATVSVILPLFNGAATVATALRGLTQQTWADLEILVVDDASTDAGPDLVADLARADRRIRLIRQPANRGSYAARNRALAEVTGDFVTVHDADDWSHPEKIARHVADLAARRAPFNVSAWARASTGLGFWGPWRPSPDLVAANFSSVFFRADLVATVGPWDTVRVSGDREFADRAAAIHGLPPQDAFLPGCPLAFGRSEAGSLTRGAFHAATLLHGIRREYREAAELWHATLEPARVRREGLAARPPFFPAPRAIRAEPGPEPRHDLLFVADFNLRGGAFHSTLAMIRAGLDAGLDAALLHYRRYDLDPGRRLDPELRRFAAARGVRIVAPGEAVRAATVIVGYPAVFQHPMDRFPAVDHDRLVVVVNQLAERDRARTSVAYDPARVRAHLVEALGDEGAWVPISARVRAAMAGDPRYPPAHPDTWTPLIDREGWCRHAPRWRGGDGGQPVLGRHGRDDPLKWPRDPAALAAAYCAERPCAVRFLGGAQRARARLGRRPRNWTEIPFGARDVQAFLADLDVFLHFPDPDYVEEFGRAPMEAMAVGVPVILPPEFAPTFGPAALYAAPDEVWALVGRLWRDRGFWEARVAAGRGFVAAHCGYDAFLARLAAPARPRAAPAGA